MKERSQKESTRKPNITTHRRTLLRKNVRKRVAELRGEWYRLDCVERGDRLRELVKDGCSSRGLAKELHVSATTVRRHVEIAELPESLRHAIVNGESAKKQLEEAMSMRAQARLADRLAIEKRTGQVSDELADVVIAFCKGKLASGMSMTRDELPLFLTSLEQHLQQPELFPVPRLRISMRLALIDRLKAAKPKNPQTDFEFAQLAEWLASFILATEPQRAIWERALKKVRRREKEFIRRSHRSIKDVMQKFGKVILLDIPARRVTGPAREVMTRQGRRPPESQ
jgi:hypothetical protein